MIASLSARPSRRRNRRRSGRRGARPTRSALMFNRSRAAQHHGFPRQRVFFKGRAQVARLRRWFTYGTSTRRLVEQLYDEARDVSLLQSAIRRRAEELLALVASVPARTRESSSRSHSGMILRGRSVARVGVQAFTIVHRRGPRMLSCPQAAAASRSTAQPLRLARHIRTSGGHVSRTSLLASASPRRRELLDQIGVSCLVRPVGIDESRQPEERPAITFSG